VWAVAGILVVCLAGADTQPSADALWRRAFAETTAPARRQVLKALLAACANDAAGRLIAADRAYEAFPPGWLRRTVEVADGATRYRVQFVVRVPRGYVPRRSWPLLLAAHGQGGTGRHVAEMMAHLLGAGRDRYVIVAPTMPGPKHFNGRAYQEQTYLRALRWTRRHLNVDDDRMYVAGYSQGGHCTWHLATMFPHLFAAAVPMAGVPWFEGSPYVSTLYMENLANLPLWAIWGERDRAQPGRVGNVDLSREAAARLRELGNRNFKGTELAGVGHGGCVPGPGQMARYLAAHRRKAVPERFEHFFHMSHHGRGYYLEAIRLNTRPVEFSAETRFRIVVPRGQRATPEMALRQVRKGLAKRMYRLHAELDRAGNALAIRTVAVGAVRLYVMEGMFDLARPVSLRFRRRTWTGRIAPSARCMLEHYLRTRDASALVLNEVDLDASGKVTIRGQ